MRALILIVVFLTGCKPKPSDRLVSIQGKSQHILVTGTGTPAVVFVAGFGDGVNTWSAVQKKVAEKTRTLSYDRSGLGSSEIIGKNRSLDSMLFELDEILKAEKIEPPYILVGHSYGGHLIRYFAHQHPEYVAGLVLVDATVEYMKEEFRRLKTDTEIQKYDSLMEHGRDPSWSEGVRNEADYFEANNESIKRLTFNTTIPTTVITAMKMPESSFDFLKGTNEMKVTLHKQWVTEAPHIHHVYAYKSGHYVHFDEPELIINEILRLVRDSRNIPSTSSTNQ